MRSTIYTGLKLPPIGLHYGRKTGTELTNLVKDGKLYFSDWSELSVAAEKKPKFYVSRDEDVDITSYLVMAKTKAEEKAVDEQPKKKNSVGEYPFKFVEKNLKRKSLNGKFQKVQTTASETEHTVTTGSGKFFSPEKISGD